MADSLLNRIAKLERNTYADQANRCRCGHKLFFTIFEDGAVRCPNCKVAVDPAAPTKSYADIFDEPQTFTLNIGDAPVKS